MSERNSAFQGDTKHTILLLLLDGEATGEQLASRLGINLSVARRHLEGLGASGLVAFAFKKKKRGRPSKFYAITTKGRTEISARYDLVADLLTMAITKDMGIEKAKELFESAAHVLSGSVGKRDNVESFLPVLAETGFEPRLAVENGKQFIMSRNCPIIKLAKKYPELTCDTFHTMFCREVLNRPDIVLRSAIARGANECVHEMPLSKS